MAAGRQARAHRVEVDPVGGGVDERVDPVERARKVVMSRASTARAVDLPPPRASETAAALLPSRSRSSIPPTSSDAARSATIAGAIVPAAPSTATLTVPLGAGFIAAHRSVAVGLLTLDAAVQTSNARFGHPTACSGCPQRQRIVACRAVNKPKERERMESAAASAIPSRRRPPPSGSSARLEGAQGGRPRIRVELVIAIASTAPAYSLAATLGFIVAVAGVGVHAPAVLIVSFIPILFVSVGVLATSTSPTRTRDDVRVGDPGDGPAARLDQGGWAIFLADIIVMAIAGGDRQQLHVPPLRNSAGAPNNFWLIVGAVVWIVVMTWICYRGIELSARIQQYLLTLEIVTLVAVRDRRAGQGVREPSCRTRCTSRLRGSTRSTSELGAR